MWRRRAVPLERFAVVVLVVTFLGGVGFGFLRRALSADGLAWSVLQIAVTVAVMWLLHCRGEWRDPHR